MMIRQLVTLMTVRLASPLASFLIIVLVARVWGRAILGQYNTVWAWLTIFQFISLFGLGEYISKEVGANHASGSKYLTHGLVFGVFSSLVCAIAMCGGAVLLEYPDEMKYAIMTASLALPFNACILICQATFMAFQKIRYIALACILETSLFLALGSAVIIHGYGLIMLFWSLIFSRVLASGLNLFLAHRRIARLSFHIDWGFFRTLFAPVAIFGLTGVAYQIFMRIDIVMLSKMTDMIAVGLYSSASKLMEMCLILPMTFYILNLPVAAKEYTSRESGHRKIETYARQLFILVFLVFGLGFLFAKSILGLTYGGPFMKAGWILKILMLAFLIHSGDMVLGMSCQAAGYHKFAMYVAIMRAATNVVFNFLFIPIWGAFGAALATLLSISLSFGTFQYFVKRTLGSISWIRIVRKPASVCLLMMALLFPLADRLNPWLLGCLFLLAYVFLLFAMNGFSIGRVKVFQS